MPRIRDRIWINTAKDEEVQKHRFLAGLQSIRNNFLKWKIKNIKLDSARIEPRNGREYGPRGDRVYDCLELLSKDLSDPTNRAEANNAIKSLVGNSEDWNDPLTIVLPLKADKLQQLRMNVKVLFTEYSFDTKATAFLQAVYNKSDAVLAGPKGYYHKKFDAPAPRELPLATNAPPQANADVPPPADPPPPADAPPPPAAKKAVEPDEVAPSKIENGTDAQPAARSTTEIPQASEKAAGPSRDSMNAELDNILQHLDSLAGAPATEGKAQTQSAGQKGIKSSNPIVPKLQLPKQVQQNDASVSTPRGATPRQPRPRLFSKAVNPEPKIQSPRSAQPPAPEKLPDQGMPPIIKAEDNGPGPTPSQQLSESIKGQPETGTPAVQATEAQPASPKRDPKQVECDTLMEDLMTLMKNSVPSNRRGKVQGAFRKTLAGAFEKLYELAVGNFSQDNRAKSLEFVSKSLPDQRTLVYFSKAMHSINLDLISNGNNLLPKIDDTKRGRLGAIVDEWQALGLTAESGPVSEWAVPDLNAALEMCKLGLQPTGPAKANA
jgi:hypothetical protein